MLKFFVHQKTMAISTAFLLALSTGAMAQSTAGTVTVADIEQAGYTDVSEVAPSYDESTTAFQATAPDGETVTIEIQQGTGEWLILRTAPASVVTTYRAGEAPANAMPIGDAAPRTGMQTEGEGEGEMMDSSREMEMDSSMEMESDMTSPSSMQ